VVRSNKGKREAPGEPSLGGWVYQRNQPLKKRGRRKKVNIIPQKKKGGTCTARGVGGKNSRRGG